MNDTVPVVALAGRRVDAPDAPPRFPATQVAVVRDRLRALFQDIGAGTLVCSGACGADLTALEVAGELGMHRRVVLPFPRDRFRATSVVDRGEAWGNVYDRVLGQLPRVDVVELGLAEGDAAYARANQAILNEAVQLAGNDSPVAVIVWEGEPRGHGDMTQNFASAARERGMSVREVRTRDA